MARTQLIQLVPLTALLGLFIVACQGLASIGGPGPTPDVSGYGYHAESQLVVIPPFPAWLNCSFITSTSPGPTIGGLQIGVSTFEEVKERIAYTALYWDREHGHLRFEGDMEVLFEDFWGLTQTCFVGEKLSAISTSYRNPGAPYDLDEWLDTYGPPDLVTWGSSYGLRTMIWAEEGILTELDLYFEESSGLLLFSPIPIEELEDSWLLQALPQEGEECGMARDVVDTACLPVEMEVPDPLGLGTLSN